MPIDFNGSIPMEHGIEIEQMEGDLPSGYRQNGWTWHRDASGPMETDIGPKKFVKSLLNDFYDHTRDEIGTWNWKAASRVAEGSNASGCGSHVHFHLTVPEDVTHEEHVKAWTISYNTLVELAPFFAPMFCHDWERGFRHGTMYSGRRSNAEAWCSAQTTRLSRSSMEDYVRGRSRATRNNNRAVTLNPRDGEKPLTIEFRFNDAHPAMALTGATFLRCIVRRCIEHGWSPKLDYEAMGYSSHSAAMEALYEVVHPTHEEDLIEDMKNSGPVIFQEDRGVPGANGREFDSMWDVIDSILTSCSTDTGTYANRVKRLVKTADAANSPNNNDASLWQADADRGDFEWVSGPDCP